MKKKRKKQFLYLLIAFFLVIIIIVGIIVNRPIYNKKTRIEKVKEASRKKNSDFNIVGWLRVQGTNIDTPIVTYKSHEAKTSDENNISNFLVNNDDSQKLYNKTNILGHNILNLSSTPGINREYYTKFEDLMGFIYYDFVKKNKYIQYTVGNKEYIYKIYSVRLEKTYDNIETVHFGNYYKNKINKYIKDSRKNSIYKFNVDVNENDKLISLITCTRFYGPDKESGFVVEGRLLRPGEKTKNYSVKPTDNYKKIRKYMKGDEENAYS